MDAAERRTAKARLVEGMLQGQSWEDAMLRSGLTMGRSNAYALTQRVCAFGAEALADHRHGHVSKMQAPVRQWLEDYCRGAPTTPSRVVQAALRERFGLQVSLTHLNRVRAVWGLGRPRRGGGEKDEGAGAAAE